MIFGHGIMVVVTAVVVMFSGVGGQDGGGDHGGFLSVTAVVFYRAVAVVPDRVVIIGGGVGHTQSRYCDLSGKSDHDSSVVKASVLALDSVTTVVAAVTVEAVVTLWRLW